MCLVSIIVPSYNHAPFLEKRLNSILNQTFTDFEVIVIDDASIDNSKNIITAFAKTDVRIRTIFNPVNTGSGYYQWRKGIENALGKYIWIAESDDYTSADFLATLMPPLLANDKAVMAYCNTTAVNELGELLWCTKSEEVQTEIESEKFIINKLLPYNTLVNAGMVVFKKAAASNVLWQIENYNICTDFYLWLHIALQGTIISVPKYLNFFCRHNASTTAVQDINNITLKQRVLIMEQFYVSGKINKHIFKRGMFYILLFCFKSSASKSTNIREVYLKQLSAKLYSVHRLQILLHFQWSNLKAIIKKWVR